MTDHQHSEDDGNLETAEARPKVKKPPMFKVMLLNDDYTPMEFVVHILENFFLMDKENATRIMMHVHTRGMGVCGVFTRDVAETKVALVSEYAQSNHHPLMCTLEEA